MSGLLTLSVLTDTPKTIILLLVIIACVAIYLVGHLLNSYPLVIVASLVTIGLSLFSFIDDMFLLGACWLIYSLIATIFAFFHFYRNVRSAFWWTLGALVALIISAVPFDVLTNVEENTAKLLTIVAPAILFLLIGIVGGSLVPHLKYKDKNERKHLTNTDPIIGQKVTVVEDKQGEFPARAVLGDIDWAIEPLYSYESFKVGDIVKVLKIKGVILLCTRDQKDYRAELKKQRKEQEISRRLEKEELAKKREAIRASKKVQNQKDKLAKQKEKFDNEQAVRKAKEARLEAKEKQKEDLRKAKEETLAAKNAAKNAKKETPNKESKPQNVVKEEKANEEPYKMFYIISSCIAILFSIIIVVIALIKSLAALFSIARFVYFAIIFVYLVMILVFECLKSKHKAVKVEEKKEQEKKAEKTEQPAKKEEEKLPETSSKDKADFIPFAVRLKKADKELKDAYNELKSEVLSYGIKSRVSSTGDSFRLHTKTYVKMVIAGKCLKLYLALNPRDYRNTTYPFDDASKMVAHKETPFVFKIKSGLSVRRAKVLISDVAKKDGLVQGEVVTYNHAKDVK